MSQSHMSTQRSSRAATSNSARTTSNGQPLFDFLAREDELLRREVCERRSEISQPNFGVPLRSDNPASQVYLALVWQSGLLGAAVYNTDSSVVDLLIDVAEKPPFEVLRSLISVVEPLHVVSSFAIDDRLREFLTSTCKSDLGTGNRKCKREERGSDTNPASQILTRDGEGTSTTGPTLHFLPGKEFGLSQAKQRIGRVRLPTMPEHIVYNCEEILLYLAGIIDFRRFSMIRAFGGLLAILDRIPPLRGPNESSVPITAIRMFTMEEDVAIDQNSLKVFHSSKIENISAIVGLCLNARPLRDPDLHPSAFKAGKGGREGLSLFALFNRCKSASGRKLLRLWFTRPTRNLGVLRSRHQAVRFFMNPQNDLVKREFEKLLSGLKDVTTTMGRLAKGVCSVNDWWALEKTALCGYMIAQVITREDLPLDIDVFGKIQDTFGRELARIAKIINDVVDREASESEERFVVKPGVAPELDDMKRRLYNLNEALSSIATEELARMSGTARDIRVTYIPNMGYLLVLERDQEMDATSDYSLPGLDFVFKAKGGLFYKSEKMRELDTDDTNFGDLTPKIHDCERAIMLQLRDIVLRYTSSLFDVMAGAAELDCVISIASTGIYRNYVVPEIGENLGIEIQDGRHPLQEMYVPTFVPNSTDLGDGKGRVSIITGPNMCGKSVYLKQVAIIVFLAHVGCPVPATSAKIGLVDKIFTRLLSEETVAVRQSAFLIDLTQVGMAVNYATDKSLIVLDEFGKGTRSSDGLALLASILSYFISGSCHTADVGAAKTNDDMNGSQTSNARGGQAKKPSPFIFLATHFHLLSELVPPSHTVRYLTLEHTTSDSDNLVFLYKVKEGVSVSSYAVETSRVAGFMDSTLKRIVEITDGIKENRRIEPLTKLRVVGGFSAIAQELMSKLLVFNPDADDARQFLDQAMTVVHRDNSDQHSRRVITAQEGSLEKPDQAVPNRDSNA